MQKQFISDLQKTPMYPAMVYEVVTTWWPVGFHEHYLVSDSDIHQESKIASIGFEY